MWMEFAKFGFGLIATLIAAWLALDRITHENRLAADREAKIELVRRFVSNPSDLNDVFRSMALLLRSGMVQDHDGGLRREVERFFSQRLEEISLSNVAVQPPPPATTTRSLLPAAALPPPAGAQVNAGASLAARVDSLNSSTPSVRTALAQELVSALRDSDLPADQQRLVADALVDMAGDERMRGLSRTGRYNLLFVLAEIPAAMWRQPALQETATELRRALQTLETRATAGTTEIGPDTRRWLDQLKQRLG